MVTITALTVVAAGCTGGGSDAADDRAGLSPTAVAAVAPEFPAGAEWLNVPQPLSLDGLQGKIVVPYFWHAGCINCLAMIDDLERLAEEFPQEVVLIGIHAPKFAADATTEAVDGALRRLGVDHPTINDADLQLWSAWAVGAWPTVALVDPAGDVRGGFSGADANAVLKPEIEALATEFEGELVAAPAYFPQGAGELAPTVLSFPGGIVADAAGDRLFIADTGHHRIVVVDLGGEVLSVIGGGDQGSTDGGFTEASFSEPRGMALNGSTLYVADTGNHLIRAIDLESERVATVAGNGTRGAFPARGGPATEAGLNAPWDIAVGEDAIYIAMAGYNQVWELDGGTIEPVVGSGRHGVGDGPLDEAALAEPTAVAVDESGRLVIAASGSSSVRRVDDGEVSTLAGSDQDLFDFGDLDAAGSAARFQRPLGVAVGGGAAWVADTYNDRIRRTELATGAVTTVAGSSRGWRDGIDALFNQPVAIDYADGALYVADSGNHSIRLVDAASGETATLILKGIEQLVPDGDGGFDGTEITLDAIEVGEGPGRVVLSVTFPPGYKANDVAPSRFEWVGEGGVVALAPTASGEVVGPEFPLELEATFDPGEGSLRADLWLVYCEITEQSICLFDRARLTAPLQVTSGGPDVVNLGYQVVLPEGLAS